MIKQWLMLSIGRSVVCSLFVTDFVQSTTTGLKTEVNTNFTVEIKTLLKHFIQMEKKSYFFCVVQFIHNIIWDATWKLVILKSC